MEQARFEAAARRLPAPWEWTAASGVWASARPAQGGGQLRPGYLLRRNTSLAAAGGVWVVLAAAASAARQAPGWLAELTAVWCVVFRVPTLYINVYTEGGVARRLGRRPAPCWWPRASRWPPATAGRVLEARGRRDGGKAMAEPDLVQGCASGAGAVAAATRALQGKTAGAEGAG